MIWILVWLQMIVGEDVPSTMKYYHLDTFTTKEACLRELKEARILVTSPSETMDCIMIDRRQGG
jgi:hypothetical protein